MFHRVSPDFTGFYRVLFFFIFTEFDVGVFVENEMSRDILVDLGNISRRIPRAGFVYRAVSCSDFPIGRSPSSNAGVLLFFFLSLTSLPSCLFFLSFT